MNKTKRGGARPGAGRPLQGTGRKKAAAIMLTPEGWIASAYLRAAGMDVNRMVDAFLRRYLPDSKEMTTFAPSRNS